MRGTLLAMLLVTGCRRPGLAPDNIEEMCAYGFAHFDDDPVYLLALVDSARIWLDDNMDTIDGGLAVNNLKASDLRSAGVADADIEGVIGAAVAYDYSRDVDLLAAAMSHPNQTEIFTSYLEFEMTTEVDRDCFLAQDCEYFPNHQDIHVDLGTLGLEADSEYEANLRWIESDDGLAFVQRNIGAVPMDISVDWLQIDQQHSFSLAFSRDGKARRLHALWVEGRIVGANVPKTFALNSGIDSMKSAASDMDAWMAAQP